MRSEIFQCELSIVNKEDSTLNLLEVSKEAGPKALCEGPDVVSATGQVEVGIGGPDVIQQLLVEDASLCEVIGVVVDQKTAAVCRDLEIVCLCGVQCAIFRLQ